MPFCAGEMTADNKGVNCFYLADNAHLKPPIHRLLPVACGRNMFIFILCAGF
jgi:hypothetical protein|tara:strand:- start:711 stop:866 length:156 start_codon:yes stop_codon:yes gene_type:complete